MMFVKHFTENIMISFNNSSKHMDYWTINEDQGHNSHSS